MGAADDQTTTSICGQCERQAKAALTSLPNAYLSGSRLTVLASVLTKFKGTSKWRPKSLQTMAMVGHQRPLGAGNCRPKVDEARPDEGPQRQQPLAADAEIIVRFN